MDLGGRSSPEKEREGPSKPINGRFLFTNWGVYAHLWISVIQGRGQKREKTIAEKGGGLADLKK